MRSLYRWLLHLHPKAFRDRFEEEMLLVYDDATTKTETLWLFGDAMKSLLGNGFFALTRLCKKHNG
jgi:hypothetical protein